MKHLFLVTFIFMATYTFAQNIVINEVQAKNTNTYKLDLSLGYSNLYPDWIELKNTTSSEVDLSGWFLSDSEKNIEKWSFPEGTKIGANSFLLVFADDANDKLHTNFKLSSSGETITLSAKDKSLVQRIEYKELQSDFSYGLISDGSYSIMNSPTPNAENDSGSAFEYLDSDLNVSIPTGLYDSDQMVELSKTGEGEIYYTLDNTTPTSASNLYTAPISINKSTVLKAIVIKSGKEYSMVESRSYIIGVHHSLPVVVITSDNSSILPSGKENIDGRVGFAFIETDGTSVIDQYAEFKESGKTSKFFPQLNGKLKANKAYGKGSFKHKMYPYKNIDKFRSFLLRNASQDWANTHLRDAFISRVLGKDNLTQTPFEAYRPAVLYVNAKYQGIINIREDDDDDYIEHNYDLEEGEFIRYGRASFISFSDLDFSIAEDRDKFNALVNFHEHLSLRLLFAFAKPSEWGWRYWEDTSGKTGLRYHYNMHDFDPIFGLAFDGANYSELDEDIISFNRLLESNITDYKPYRDEALHYIAAQLNHVYNKQRTLGILNEMQNVLKDEIPAHAVAMTELANASTRTFKETSMPFADIDAWNKNMDDLRTNVSNRVDDDVFARLMAEYALDGMINITYESSDIKEGYITVQDVKVLDESYTGTYFKNIPIRFKAKPLPGYRFVGWEGDYTGTAVEITPTFSANAQVKAIFERIRVSDNLRINEVQVSNENTIKDESDEYEDWIEIYNPTDAPVNLANYYISDDAAEPLKWKIPDTNAGLTTVPSKGFLLLWADKDISQGENHVNFKLSSSDHLLLTKPDGVTSIQHLESLAADTDKSFGAAFDGSANYVVFDIPTPNKSNGVSTETETVFNQHKIITLAPNPANTYTNIIGVDEREQLNWKLYDTYGGIVKTGTGHRVGLHNLNSGVYILNINNDYKLKLIKK